MEIKKAVLLLLAAVMIVTSFPAFSTAVHLVELPTTIRFATMEQLKFFIVFHTLFSQISAPCGKYLWFTAYIAVSICS